MFSGDIKVKIQHYEAKLSSHSVEYDHDIAVVSPLVLIVKLQVFSWFGFSSIVNMKPMIS